MDSRQIYYLFNRLSIDREYGALHHRRNTTSKKSGMSFLEVLLVRWPDQKSRLTGIIEEASFLSLQKNGNTSLFILTFCMKDWPWLEVRLPIKLQISLRESESKVVFVRIIVWIWTLVSVEYVGSCATNLQSTNGYHSCGACCTRQRQWQID